MDRVHPVVICVFFLICSCEEIQETVSQRNETSTYRSILSDEQTEIPYLPRDCADLFLNGYNVSGIYSIRPLNWEYPFEVYCDMQTDNGGWTMIQRRGDFYGFPEDYFFKSWKEYKYGFGDLAKEFWLGNERIFALTRQGAYQLRVDLWDGEENEAHAKYGRFWIANETDLYRLNIGGYTGTAGNAMLNHNLNQFTTKDRDVKGCIKSHKGAWWNSHYCHNANLNGLNLKGPTEAHANGIVWYDWKEYRYSLAFTEMKIRPREFLRLL